MRTEKQQLKLENLQHNALPMARFRPVTPPPVHHIPPLAHPNLRCRGLFENEDQILLRLTPAMLVNIIKVVNVQVSNIVIHEKTIIIKVTDFILEMEKGERCGRSCTL